MSDPSNWADATREAEIARVQRELKLVCPKCGESNTNRTTIIVLEPDGQADCTSCGHHFQVISRLP